MCFFFFEFLHICSVFPTGDDNCFYFVICYHLCVQKTITIDSIKGALEPRLGVDSFTYYAITWTTECAYGPLYQLSHIQTYTHTTTLTGQLAFGWWINIENTCFVNHHKTHYFQVCVVRSSVHRDYKNKIWNDVFIFMRNPNWYVFYTKSGKLGKSLV